MITVYHGSVITVKQPIAKAGRENLDFGQGFYVTDIKEQAERWAFRVANDRVIDTVEAYMNGMMTVEMALGQLSQHQPNNQFCLLNQQLIDQCLQFISVEQINL